MTWVLPVFLSGPDNQTSLFTVSSKHGQRVEAHHQLCSSTCGTLSRPLSKFLPSAAESKIGLAFSVPVSISMASLRGAEWFDKSVWSWIGIESVIEENAGRKGFNW